MFSTDAVKDFAWDRARVKLAGNDTWSVLKSYADTIRENPWLSSSLMGGVVPAPKTDVTAFNAAGPDYLVGGAMDANRIAKAVKSVHGEREDLNILDFGCGAARLVRYFNNFWPQHNYWACDVNQAAVDFIPLAAPGVQSFSINSEPSLPLPSGSMDVIYAWSIWTHLNEEIGIAWLTELKRVLRPGGCAIITVHVDEVADRYATEPMLIDRLKISPEEYGLVQSRYNDTGFAFWKHYPNEAGIDSETFGMTLSSREWIKNHWSDLFSVEQFMPAIEGWQDIVVLVNDLADRNIMTDRRRDQDIPSRTAIEYTERSSEAHC